MTPTITSTEARHRSTGFPGWWTLAAQFAMVGAGALCYFGVRGLTRSDVAAAQLNATRVVDLEAGTGLLWETTVQGWVIDSDHLVTAVNWIYIYAHWPVIIGSLVWLFLRRPGEYYTLRNAIFASGAIGLLIFMTFPVAPPRFGAIDLVDTITQPSSPPASRTSTPRCPACTSAGTCWWGSPCGAPRTIPWCGHSPWHFRPRWPPPSWRPATTTSWTSSAVAWWR